MSHNTGFGQHLREDLGSAGPLNTCYARMGVCVCVRPKPVFRGPPCLTYLYCEVIWYSEVRLPRSGLIFTLHARTTWVYSLAKFGQRPLNTCFIPPAFKPALKTADCSANGGMVVTQELIQGSSPLHHPPPTQIVATHLV